MNIYIHQHLGLGDHIICNGLIRTLCAFHPEHTFLLFCKRHNLTSVSFMFRDVANVTCIPVLTDEEAEKISKESAQKVIKIGHEHLSNDIGFDVSFYKQLGMDISRRWASFYVDRDYASEMLLLERHAPKQEYIFVHEDPSRDLRIKESYLEGKTVFRPSLEMTKNIWDYLSVIENAKEIHCIESSFLFLIDSFIFKAKLFSHRYARSYPPNNKPALKNRWNIL